MHRAHVGPRHRVGQPIPAGVEREGKPGLIGMASTARFRKTRSVARSSDGLLLLRTVGNLPTAAHQLSTSSNGAPVSAWTQMGVPPANPGSCRQARGDAQCVHCRDRASTSRRSARRRKRCRDSDASPFGPAADRWSSRRCALGSAEREGRWRWRRRCRRSRSSSVLDAAQSKLEVDGEVLFEVSTIWCRRFVAPVRRRGARHWSRCAIAASTTAGGRH